MSHRDSSISKQSVINDVIGSGASESYERVTDQDLLVYPSSIVGPSPRRSHAHQGRLGVSPRWGRAHRGRLSCVIRRFLVFWCEGGRASRLRSSPLTGLDP